MNKIWNLVKKENEKLIYDISKKFNLSPIISQVLINRGFEDVGSVNEYLNVSLNNLPDPNRLPDINIACERIIKAIKNQEKIAIHGDYDVDGITATACLYLFFREIGVETTFYIPNRFTEGYDLSMNGIINLAKNNIKLIITCDCGTRADASINKARELGIDVIVTDHHEADSTLPEAFALINPKRNDSEFPDKELGGVGVAFYLIIALRRALTEQNFFKNKEIPNLKKYLDLVCLGLVADIVPILGVNRILIKHGLIELNKFSRPGILALKEMAKLSSQNINYWHISFILAPRLNSAGRLASGERSVSLLISSNETEASKIASFLEEKNKDRKNLGDEIFNSIAEKIEEKPNFKNEKAIVMGSSKWHEGVIGIVASRLAEKYFKPTILISFSEDIGKGSARSIKGFDIYNAISKLNHLLEGFGGHKYAAGLKIKKDNFEEFKEEFLKLSFENIEEQLPSIDIDTEVNLENIDFSLVNDLEKLEPFGPGNREPVFMVNDLSILNKQEFGKHMKLKLKSRSKIISAIGFNMSHRINQVSEKIDVAFNPIINNFNGEKKLELKLVDFKCP